MKPVVNIVFGEFVACRRFGVPSSGNELELLPYAVVLWFQILTRRRELSCLFLQLTTLLTFVQGSLQSSVESSAWALVVLKVFAV